MNQNKYSADKLAAPQHFTKVESFRRGEITAPIYVRVKPINTCNHGCRWCVYKADRKDGEIFNVNHEHMAPIDSGMHLDMVEKDVMPTAKMLEILEDFRSMSVKAVTFSGGGEPLMHKDIVMFMQRCLNFGIDLSIITNGQMLSGARAEVLNFAKWVRVSMDYTNGEQMQKSRVVPSRLFDGVMANLAAFAKSKHPSCDLGVNFIVHYDNHNDLFYFAQELYRIGVESVRFSPMWCPDFHVYHKPIAGKVLSQLLAIRAMIDDGVGDFAGKEVNTTYDLSNPAHGPERSYSKCYFMQVVPVIGADQKVYACHNKAYDPTGCIGSIAEQSFKSLWFSAAAKTFFETLNPKCVCKHQCANDSKNHLLHRLVDMHVDNFV